jgi:Flp pilus assembly protein TadD
MSAGPPPSLLITPDLRRRLQQRYEQALALATAPRPDFRRIHELLAECVAGDPGNILYLDALLANLRRKRVARGGWRQWWGLWFRRPGKRSVEVPTAGDATTSSVLSIQCSVLAAAPAALWNAPKDANLLRQLAAAASDCGFDEIELRYLATARESAPDDPETLRLLARALTRQGRFEEAIGPWFAVLALSPADAEAQRAIEDLREMRQRGDGPAVAQRAAPSSDPATLLEEARAMQIAGDFASAETHYAHAQSALGADLTLLHERENLRLARSQERLAIARRRAEHDPDPKAQALVGKLQEEHNRLEIDVYNMRAERMPQAADVRIELARRLKWAANFSGAIQRLEEAQRLEPDNPVVAIELGECWQHLRQFAKALGYYEQAAAKALQADSETLQLAQYRAAVLAAAMGQIDVARLHFAAIVAANPDFKDARERLDNLSMS